MRVWGIACAMLCGVVLSLGALAQRPPAPTAPKPGEMDLCRQQLAGLHDRADATERSAAMMLADVEAQKATLVEWLQAAQAGRAQ